MSTPMIISSDITNSDGNRCLKVFFPERFCGCQSGYLIGYYVNPMTICIGSVCQAPGQRFDRTPLATKNQSDLEAPMLLGFIYDQDNDKSYGNSFEQFQQSHHQWIKLCISWKEGYCHIHYKNTDQASCLLIIYQRSGKETFMSNQALQQVVIQASDNHNSDILQPNSSELETCLKYINRAQNQSFDRLYSTTKQPFRLADFLFLTFTFHIANIIWLKLANTVVLSWFYKWIKILLSIVRY